MKRKAAALISVFLLLLSLAGCGGYSSSYRATLLVRSETPDSSYMSFYTLDGRMVFRMKSAEGQRLRYEAELEDGSLTVYYDCGGGKEELCRLRGGEARNDETEPLGKGTVYIILETSGKCSGGKFTFEID